MEDTRATHSPGPWEVHPWGDNEHEVVCPTHTVCNVSDRGEPDNVYDYLQVEADAHLIAAAPVMLDALRAAVRALNTIRNHRVGDTDSYSIASMCDKAIATAEGRTT